MISFFLLLTHPSGEHATEQSTVIGPFAYVVRPSDTAVTLGLRADIRVQLFGVGEAGQAVVEHQIVLMAGALPYGGETYRQWKVIDELEYAALSRRPAAPSRTGRTHRAAPSPTAGDHDWGHRVAPSCDRRRSIFGSWPSWAALTPRPSMRIATSPASTFGARI